MKRMKERTDLLRKHLPNAGIGANYSPLPRPHRYLGEVHKGHNLPYRDNDPTFERRLHLPDAYLFPTG